MKRKLTGAAALAATLALLAPAIARTAGAEVTSFPVTVSFFSPCSGEQLTVSGDVKVVSHGVTDASGSQHSTVMFHANLTGYGANGNQYVYVSTFLSAETIQADWSIIATRHDTLRVISGGDANNDIFQITTHWTLTENNELIVRNLGGACLA